MKQQDQKWVFRRQDSGASDSSSNKSARSDSDCNEVRNREIDWGSSSGEKNPERYKHVPDIILVDDQENTISRQPRLDPKENDQFNISVEKYEEEEVQLVKERKSDGKRKHQANDSTRCKGKRENHVDYFAQFRLDAEAAMNDLKEYASSIIEDLKVDLECIITKFQQDVEALNTKTNSSSTPSPKPALVRRKVVQGKRNEISKKPRPTMRAGKGDDGEPTKRARRSKKKVNIDGDGDVVAVNGQKNQGEPTTSIRRKDKVNPDIGGDVFVVDGKMDHGESTTSNTRRRKEKVNLTNSNGDMVAAKGKTNHGEPCKTIRKIKRKVNSADENVVTEVAAEAPVNHDDQVNNSYLKSPTVAKTTITKTTKHPIYTPHVHPQVQAVEQQNGDKKSGTRRPGTNKPSNKPIIVDHQYTSDNNTRNMSSMSGYHLPNATGNNQCLQVRDFRINAKSLLGPGVNQPPFPIESIAKFRNENHAQSFMGNQRLATPEEHNGLGNTTSLLGDYFGRVIAENAAFGNVIAISSPMGNLEAQVESNGSNVSLAGTSTQIPQSMTISASSGNRTDDLFYIGGNQHPQLEINRSNNTSFLRSTHHQIPTISAGNFMFGNTNILLGNPMSNQLLQRNEDKSIKNSALSNTNYVHPISVENAVYGNRAIPSSMGNPQAGGNDDSGVQVGMRGHAPFRNKYITSSGATVNYKKWGLSAPWLGQEE